MVSKAQTTAGEDRLKNLVVAVPLLVAAVISVVNIGLNMSSEAVPTTTTLEPPQAIELTASQLYTEYQADEEAADASYKGKHVQVSGILSGWGSEFSPYVTLVGDDSGDGLIKCIFYDVIIVSDMPTLLGEEVTIMGICDGLSQDVVIITNSFSLDIIIIHLTTPG